MDSPAPTDIESAAAWFARGRNSADARLFDEAIDCYIAGLRLDPDNLSQHEALLEVAKRRKVAGGMPATLMERLKRVGKDPLERFLHAERIWAKEPLNKALMFEVIGRAEAAGRDREDLGMDAVARWVVGLLEEQARYDKLF